MIMHLPLAEKVTNRSAQVNRQDFKYLFSRQAFFLATFKGNFVQFQVCFG